MGYVYNNSLQRRTPLKSKSVKLKRSGKTEGHPRDARGSFLPKPGARSEKDCPNCGKRYWYWTAQPRRSCSRACTYALSKKKTRAERQCQFCGVTFSFVLSTLRVDPRRGKYCSVRCRNAAKVKRHEEKGTPERYKNEAHLIGDKKWKEAVRKKDNYTCQKCGKYDLYIHAHHVAPRSRRPDLIRVVKNGKCLCSSCHAWVHMHPKEATQLGLLSDETYELAKKLEAA